MIDGIFGLIFAQVIASNLNIVSEILSLIMRLCGLQTFTRTFRGRTALSDYIKKGFYTSEFADIPGGIVVGKWYFGIIKKQSWPVGEFKLDLVCSKAQWDLMCVQSKINKFNFEMDQYWLRFGTKTIKCMKLNARPLQQKIIDKITNLFNQQNFATVFMSGPPGVGKTKIASLLTQYYKGVICKTSVEYCIRNITEYYHDVMPNITKPFIVLLDEVDESINKIFDKPFTVSNDSTAIKPEEDDKISKRTWNGLFDDIGDGSYPYTIFILISNLTKIEIDKMNNSLLREGRINLHVQMTKDNVTFN